MINIHKLVDNYHGHKFVEENTKLLDEKIYKMFKYGVISKPYLLSHLHESPTTHNIDNIKIFITDDSLSQPYERRKHEYKRCLHWGQLKLALGEIEFLIRCIKDYNSHELNIPILALYVGAAPGNHIRYLTELFPNIIFHLYDPNDFADDLYNVKNITIFKQFFLDSDTELYVNITKTHYLIFISDIRSVPATSKMVKQDMQRQFDWWLTIQPELTMFKFRLPWEEGKTIYPRGDIYIQPFAGRTSTETRLIIKKNAEIIEYDNIKYESQLFYHNRVDRVQYYQSVLGNLNLQKHIIDNCYDCTRFVKIATEYLHLINIESTSENIYETVRQMQNNLVHGKNIYSKTIQSINEDLKNMYNSCYEPCENRRCEYCFHQLELDELVDPFFSTATNENYENEKKIRQQP